MASVDQLHAFVEIARAGSVSRAAEKLHLTQPAASARLQALERELGHPLFVRTRRGMHLTDGGRAFLAYAERALETLAAGRRVMQEVARGEAGELALGAAPAISTYVLPGLLKRFAERHPRLQLRVKTGHSEEVLEMVLRDEVQVGLLRELPHPQTETVPFYEDKLVLVVAGEHPFATHRRIKLEDLAGEQLILFDTTSSYHALTSAFFRDAGVEPAGVMELDNIDAAKKMVEGGLGFALLPQTAVSRELEAGVLRAVEIKGVEPVRRRIVAMRRRDGRPPPAAVSDFIATLAESWPAAPRAQASPHGVASG
jgi:DNA-binding transcriptional LysR family regulator